MTDAERVGYRPAKSAIHNQHPPGLGRVRIHGAEGFARTVALSMLAFNLHRLGLELRRRSRWAA